VRRFDPAEAWETAEREDATAVTMVGDAFGRPLLDALRRRPRDLPHLRTINNGGAAVSRPVRDGLLELLPRAALADALGSSESGVLAAGQSRLHLQPGGAVLSADLTRVLGPGTDELGWLATGGRIPLGYLHDPGTTAATFPRIGGVRHSVPGDRVVLRADGTLDFRGRDSMTVNSGGEKVFVEEVEQALAAHPAVADVLVVGRASERWGQELVAVVQAAGRPVERGELLAACESRLARYKWPKDVIWVEAVRRSPSGKGDYRWAAAIAAGRRPGQD
jgi:acyl-CoA synthetase (AMP-forming)/AMP-acid ligase II